MRIIHKPKSQILQKSILIFVLCFFFASLGWAQQTLVNAGTKSSAILHQPKERDIFTVAFIADRTGGWPEDIKYLKRAVYEINQLDPEFVIHTGDMVEGYTRNVDLWMREYEEFKSVMNQLHMPWYPTAGNHDVISGSRDPNDRTFEGLYKRYFGPLYYSFDYKNSHFICLYTDEAQQSQVAFSNAQLQWLENDLKSADKTNIFVYMHKPAWDEYYGASGWWDRVHELLKKYPVRAVIAGHYHSYRKFPSKDGVQYYILGATGGNLYDKVELAGRINHYNILRVEGDTFTMGVVKLGNVESDDYVVQEDADNAYKLTSQRNIRVEGWLWQPVRDEVTGKVAISIANPLAAEISVELHFEDDNTHWEVVSMPDKLVIAPKSSVMAEIELHSPKTPPESVAVPKFVVKYLYTTRQNKVAKLPVRVWIPLRASYEIHQNLRGIAIDGSPNESAWQNATILYTKSWTPSYYEREDEPTPTVRIAAGKDYLYFSAVAPDDVYEYYYDENRSDRLLSDYIVFTAADGDNSKAILIFPFNDAQQAFSRDKQFPKPSELELIEGDKKGSSAPLVEYASSKQPNKGLYICEGRVRYDQLFGTKNVAGKEFAFNVEVVDNDRNAFTYLRSWAYVRDKGYWGILRFVSP
ncbi:MAG: metallophosphoesterase [Candidatus Poribacteria bacterium]